MLVDDEGSGCAWQAVFVTKRGQCLGLDYWFSTEKAARKWIKKHLLKSRLLP